MIVINIVLPIFLLIMLGWVQASYKFIPTSVSKSLMQYLYLAAGPAVIFSAISSYHLNQLFNWQLWVSYPIIIFVMTALSFLVFKYIFSEPGIHAITTAYSTTVKNTVIIGFPILMGMIGKDAAIPMAMTVIFFNCLMMPILILLLEMHSTKTHSKNKTMLLLSSLFGTLKNPLVFASLAGVIGAGLDITIPVSLNKMLAYLSGSFLPCALFAVGIDLSTFKLRGNLLKTCTVAVIGLILTPLLAIALCFALSLTATQSISLVILSAVPTAQVMYVYVSRYHLFESEVAAIVTSTTFFSVFTMPVFIYACYLLWPGGFVQGAG